MIPFLPIGPTPVIPTESNVRDGVSYGFGQTGTLDPGGAGFPLLDLSVVKIDTDRGDGQKGTYNGSDRNSDPGVANVRAGVSYKANSTTNNRTGTLDVAGGSGATADEIAAAVVSALSGTIEVNPINPTDAEGNTTLVQGDDYTNNAVADRRLTYTVTGFTGDISAATVSWKIVPRTAYDKHGAAAAKFTVAGTATLASGVLTMKVPVTQVQTAALTEVSKTDSDYRYKVQVSLIGSDGKVLTQVLGDCAVLKKVT